jgi:acetyl esterase/lipase
VRTASQEDAEQALKASHAGIDRVVARLRDVYRRWGREASNAEMRLDWDALFWSDTMPATIELLTANGIDAAWISAPGVEPGKVAIYFHGGGFRLGSLRSHRDLMARISAASGCRVLGVDYRLAPEHRFPAAHDDALAVYDWVLAQGIAAQDIALVGDSAGGCLALSTAHALRDTAQPMPAAIATMSAWTDLSASCASYDTHAGLDPIHQRPMIVAVARNYLGPDIDPRDHRASPLFADPVGLPPLLMQVGGRETVLDDTRDFARKAEHSGCAVTLEVWDDMIHVFQQFPDDLPEARLAIASLGAFLRRWLGVAA